MVTVPAAAAPEAAARAADDPWILLGSGEVSSDVAGALVAAELRRRAPTVALRGLGGHRMAGAGVELLSATNHLGVVGVWEAARFLPELWRLHRRLRAELDRSRPRAALLLGNDVFHTLLGRMLRRRGVPVVSFFPPQVWIWRRLLRWVVPSFDRVLTSFPEEHEAYLGAGARCEFVGSYLTDRLRPTTPADTRAARRRLGAEDGATLVALFPGSRRQETDGLSPIVLAAAARMAAADPELRFVLALAEPEFEPRFASALAAHQLSERVLLTHHAHDALRAADLAVLVSGTASLESALLGTPCLVVYRVATLTRLVVRVAGWLGLIAEETVALPNLVAGAEVVPELRQSRARPDRVAERALALLADPAARDTMRDAFAEVRRRVERGGTIQRVATQVLELSGIADDGLSEIEVPDVLASAAS